MTSEIARLPVADMDPASALDYVPESMRRMSPEAIAAARGAKSASTLRNYAHAWRGFVAWCSAKGVCPLPADAQDVASFAAERAKTVKNSTLTVDLAAIRAAHELHSLTSPTLDGSFKKTRDGLRRQTGVRVKQKNALPFDDIAKIAAAIPNDCLAGLRDRAIVLVGFAGAFRRSELVSVLVEDVRFARNDAGVTILVRRSKTDQEGAGRWKEIGAIDDASCPVAALRAWLNASRITSGHVFRRVWPGDRVGEDGLDGGHVAAVVKKYAAAVGMDVANYSGHSLRAGFVTEAAIQNVPFDQIRETTWHKGTEVLMGYIRRANGQENSITGSIMGGGRKKK